MTVNYSWLWSGTHWYSWAIGTVPYVIIHSKVKEDGSVEFNMSVFIDPRGSSASSRVDSRHKRLGDAIGNAQGFVTSEIVRNYFKGELERMAKITDKKGKVWAKVKAKIEPILEQEITVTWEQYNPQPKTGRG